MKTLITILSLLVSMSAFADNAYYIQEGDSFVKPMDGIVSVQTVTEGCPTGALCAPVTQVVVDFPLMGCLDNAYVNHKVVYDGNTQSFDVYISAYNVFNKGSLVAFCTAMPRHVEKIHVAPGFWGEESVRVHFIGVDK